MEDVVNHYDQSMLKELEPNNAGFSGAGMGPLVNQHGWPQFTKLDLFVIYQHKSTFGRKLQCFANTYEIQTNDK